MRPVIQLPCGLLRGLLCCTVLLAQAPNGRLAGTIYDQAGARLDHAAVTLHNAATGTESSTQPNDKGDYHFENLPVGKYSIRVSANGLTTVQINDIVVQTTRTATINVTLPTPESTPVSVVEVSEAPTPPADAPPPSPSVSPAPLPTPPDDPAEGAKAILREINAIRDRLALSADQQLKIRAVFQERQAQIANIRNDSSVPAPARRDRIKALRAEADTKFRALLTENQLDEYDEILRERHLRAIEQKLQTASTVPQPTVDEKKAEPAAPPF